MVDIQDYFSGNKLYDDLDQEKIAQILSKAITFNTVSYEDPHKMDGDAFKGLHAHFAEAFPLVHSKMEKTVINEWSLIYYLKGSDPSLKPALFMAHLDVVPVMPGTEEDWVHPPFSGHIEDNFIWGRGAIDTKSMVVGELSAVEYLLEKGMMPKRDIYLVFGHDEETMGIHGSLAAKEYLKKKGVALEFAMDEGGGFKMGEAYGAPGHLLAQIDIFEKGYIDVAVKAQSKGGHSSRPGKGTALGKVAKAITLIEENQLTPAINPVVENMFLALKPIITEEPFKSLVAELVDHPEKLAEYLSGEDHLAPMVMTTTALTMINGSPAPNVLPQNVKALINFRIAPGEDCEKILNHCKAVAGNPDVEIYMTKGMNPSKISQVDSPAFEAITASTKKFFKEVTVVPGLVTGGTDCRYFEDICDCCYRFRPYIDNMVLRNTTHGTNERCDIKGLIQGIKIIIDVMLEMCYSL